MHRVYVRFFILIETTHFAAGWNEVAKMTVLLYFHNR